MKKVLFLTLIALLSVLVACEDDPKPVRTRVATMPTEQKPASPAPARDAEPPEEGRAEHTNMGTIMEVFSQHISEGNHVGDYLGVTFQEDGGFVKRFVPICGGQTIQIRPVAIMYHWKSYDSDNVGCYWIDGLQTK